MLKIILWGTGKVGAKLIKAVDDEIVLVVDNDEKKWGSLWNGYVVNSPQCLNGYNNYYDKIVIAVADWKSVREQIIQYFNIATSSIENMYYRQKAMLLKYYEDYEEHDKRKYILYLQKNPLEVFNDEFTKKYVNLDFEVYYDSQNALHYLIYNGKKMYFPSRFSTKEQVKKYCHALIMEQDPVSPHRYQTDAFHVSRHDIVLDAGVAEGNFALDIIDLVDKLYLVECDEEWIEALKCTFAPYKDKVEIIQEILGDGHEGSKTIDEIVGNRKIDFIKMDIEGAELKALRGAEQSLKQNDVKLAVCVYHNVDDEKNVKMYLDEIGYETEVSDGYMVFITEQFYESEVKVPKFVRGLVRGKRKET